MIMCTDLKQRIQTLFLQPAESYELREVARLTDTPDRSLRREVAAGLRDAEKVRWTLAEIQDALGDEAAAVLPPLLALRAVTVRLPEYIVRALETVAAEDQTILDASLYGELIDFAGTHLTRLEATIPGYRRAYLFPGRE